MKREGRRARFGFASLLVGLWLSVSAAATPPSEAGDEAEPERAPFEKTAAGQAPAGVPLDRPLAGGEWRLSYRFVGTWRKDNWIGSKRVSALTARAVGNPDYERVPRTRDSAVHIVGLDWAPHDRITLVVRVPLVSTHQATNGFAPPGVPDTDSFGIGDIGVGVLVPFMRKGEESTSVSLIFGTPSGSIYEEAAGGQRLPYPMQPGGGSWTVAPGFTYMGRFRDLSWGGQFGAVFRLNDNPLGYQRGTEWRLTGWLGWSFGDYISTSLRAEWYRWGNIGGIDEGQPQPFASPEQDPTRQGGQRFDLGPGINFRLPCCKDQRLAIEAVFPLWQDLKGPQLGNSWVLNAAWRMTF